MRDWEQYVRQHLTLPDFVPPREARIVAELASQFEDFHRDATARGLTDDEADAYARAQITDWAALADMLRAADRPHVRSRLDRWGEHLADRARERSRRVALLADLWQDLRDARRRLAAEPGFAAVTIGTLAIGVGLCCLLFAVLNGFALQPLPGAREPERLVSLQAPVSYPYFEAYRDGAGTAGALAFIGPVPFNVSTGATSGAGGARPERVSGHIVSPDYFATLGVEPLLGRLIGADGSYAASDRPEMASAVVVSERFWRTRLNGDPAAIGRTLRINGGQATVIGVAARGFAGAFPIGPADLFLPVGADPSLAPELRREPGSEAGRGPGGESGGEPGGERGAVLTRTSSPTFRVVFRLAQGQSIASLREAIELQTRALDQQYGGTQDERSERSKTTEQTERDKRDQRDERVVRGERDAHGRTTPVSLLAAGGLMPSPPSLRRITAVFFGTLIVLILSFTCANLAGVMLARGDGRSREIAVRLSLGAGRFRLVRQLLTESLLLAIGGGAAGFAAAYLLLALLARSLADSPAFSTASRLTPDLRVAAGTFAIAMLAGVIVGLAPALAATRPDLLHRLKDGPARGTRHVRRFGLRNLFLVYQMTAATALTVVIGFMVGGVYRSARADLGVDADRAWLVSLDLARDGFSRDEARAFLLALPERLATIGGIDGVSFTDAVPFAATFPTTAVAVAAGDRREAIHHVATQRIGPGFAAALGLPRPRGMELTSDPLRVDAADDALMPVVINETAARQLFGGRDPIGGVIRHESRRLQVVGVARYGKPGLFASEPAPTLLLPLTAADLVPGPPDGLTIVLHSQAGVGLPAVAGAIARVDARASAFNLRSVRQAFAQLDRGVHYGTALYALLGTFAIGLASIGLAGVTAQAVVRRRREIGIRVALGAARGSVLRLVMRDAIVMAGIGALLGAAVAVGLARVLASMNREFSQTLAGGASVGLPPLAAAAPLLLVGVALAASYLPARRSTAIDPLITIREE